ncbi:MAG: 6-bladed beta-propeller, partial [Gemmatimonadales bacterium]
AWLLPTAAMAQHGGQLVWPAPPEPARLQFLGEFHSEKDLGRKEGLFSRLRRSLSGAGPEASIRVQRPFDVYTRDGNTLLFSDGASGVVEFDRRTKKARLLGQDVPGGLVRPLGMGGDGQGRVYIADPGAARVVVLGPTGSYERAFGGREILYNPVDVAVDPGTERIYVVDAYLHQVVIFDRSGAVTGRLGKATRSVAERPIRILATEPHGGASPPAAPTQANGEADPAIVSQHQSAGVSLSEPRDLWENRGGGDGEFRYPSSIAVGPDGRVYVVDQMNFRVQVFDRTGRFVRQIGQLGDQPGAFARPKGVAVDGDGHLYVSDAAFNNIQVFDADGRLLLSFGGLGHGPGQHWMPLGLCVDGTNRIYVADRYNNRAAIYQYLGVPASTPGADR